MNDNESILLHFLQWIYNDSKGQSSLLCTRKASLQMHDTPKSCARGQCLSEGVSVTAPVFDEDTVRFDSIQVQFYHCEGENDHDRI
jgi:hypothetical protein